MKVSEEFGRNVHKRRKEMALSQEQLAEKCSLSFRHISNIESGKTNPKLDTVVRICLVCNIDTGDLPKIYEREIALV